MFFKKAYENYWSEAVAFANGKYFLKPMISSIERQQPASLCLPDRDLLTMNSGVKDNISPSKMCLRPGQTDAITNDTHSKADANLSAKYAWIPPKITPEQVKIVLKAFIYAELALSDLWLPIFEFPTRLSC